MFVWAFPYDLMEKPEKLFDQPNIYIERLDSMDK